uniref:DEAD/SNF2-like helicase n=1 Tax=Pithovirus LCPAC403 TaxID=2506596 RepID=A0A481ZB07_9VIRU|nr:MAG: DEAD/SNF2-like helicase [Pithovirus LCPAC403]
MDLSDLLPLYPSQNDPNIQTIVYSKKEFRDFSLEQREEIPKRWEYFTHQKLLPRLMRFCDSLLIIAEAGTGKTLTVIAVAEHMRDHPELEINTCHILTHNEPLGAQFKSEVIKISKTFWNIQSEKTSHRATKTAITNALKCISVKNNGEIRNPPFSYDTSTMITFGVYLMNKTDAQLKRIFAGSLIVIDEVHKLASKDLTPDKWKMFYKERDIVENGKEGDLKTFMKNKGNPSRSEMVYMRIHHLLHIAKVKILLLSATPMENDPSELGIILNLILPYKSQMNFSKEWWSKATKEQLEPYFRGKISYVRAIDNGVDLEVIGEELSFELKGDQVNRTLFTSQMSPLQIEAYKKAKLEDSSRTVGLAVSRRAVSNFVYPDGTYEDKKHKYIYPKPFQLPHILPRMSPEMQNALRLENLHKYSPKYKAIFEIKEKYKYRTCMIYSPYVTLGSHILTAIFFYNGYILFTGVENISSKDDYKRFATITTEVDSEERLKILDTLSSPENHDGRIISVIISSALIIHGFNLGNILLVQIAGSEWNESKNYQAIRRGVRATSHVAILSRMKKDERVKILIYQHASILSENELIESIDTRMYGVAQLKDKSISRILRIAKEYAIDCMINRRRNVRDTDLPYSSECDYNECSYECGNTDVDEKIDYSTYNILYNDEVIDKLANVIENLFSESSRFTFDDIAERMKGSTRKYILRALRKLTSEKIPVLNKFGMTSYVMNYGDEVYLRRDYPIQESYLSDSYYTDNLTAILKKDPVPIHTVDDKKVIEVLETSGSKFWDLYYKLPTVTRIDILEQAMIDGTHPELIERLGMLVLDREKVHIIKNQIPITKVAFSVTTSYKNFKNLMKILDENGWREATPAEEVRYGKLLKKKQERIENDFDKKKVYATIATADGKMRIRDRVGGEVGKKKKKGKNCGDWTVKDLIEKVVLHYMLKPPLGASITYRRDRRRFLIEKGYSAESVIKLTGEKIELLYGWYARETRTQRSIKYGYNKEEICATIEKFFKDNDLILYI